MDAIINITITTSITTLIILGIKFLLRNKISPKAQFALWIIVGLRLLVPVLPQSSMSIFNTVPQVKNIETSHIPIESIEPQTKAYVRGNIVVGEKDKEFILSKGLVDNAIFIWLSGAIIMLIYVGGSYFIYNRKAKKFAMLNQEEINLLLQECKDKLNINGEIKVRLGGETPLLKGIFNPEIIIPEGYSKEELRSVFLHELTHYKHKDILLNIISTLFLCIYWYNPIMWFSFSVFRRDMEILCDYRVLEVYKNKKEYAEVLLKTALKNNKFLLCSTSMQNGEKDITRRIKYIAYFKKPKLFWSSVGIIVAVAIAAGCLTNPVGKAFNSPNKLDYEKIYSYKTSYVGDASKVGNLTDRLYYGEYKNGFELHTESEPYGATINYLYKLEDLYPTDEMMKNAAIMFCLIDNVDNINFDFDTGEKSKRFSLGRGIFEHILNKDLREYSTSFQKFNEEFIPMIENQNWSTVIAPMDNISDAIKEKVEKKLEVIISSPKSSSNPNDYIKAHDREYEDILKMGDEALQYMLSVFKNKEAKGIKAHIMMSLCIELLGDRNNVLEGTYSSPEEWYEKLSPYTASKLPPFKYETSNKIEQMVYLGAIDRYSGGRNDEVVTIVAPRIFGTYENDKELKMFVTVYYSEFKLYDKTLSEYSAGIVPGAIVYSKNNDGSYSFKEYIEAMDGAEWAKSIENFCKPRGDIAKDIIDHYGNREDLSKLMNENLIKYLKENKMDGIKLKQRNGEIIPLTY